MFGVTTNMSSLIAQNSLGKASNQMSITMQRLSTGMKINSGADGPAAFVISQQQQAQIVGMQTAINNTAQAVSLVQTANGALGTISDLLDQMRSLALDAANSGVNSSAANAADQAQIANALQTIDRIAQTTQFNGKNILSGGAGGNSVSTDNADVTATATSSAVPNNYAVVITQAAVRANVTAGATQTGLLAANETLTITPGGGAPAVNIALKAGLSQDQVVNTINQYTTQTGVKATTDGAQHLVLYSANYGTAGNFTVQSDTAAGSAGTTTGIDTTAITTSNGADIAGTINGTSFTGTGNVLTGAGSSAGIAVTAGLAAGSNFATVTGSANVTVAATSSSNLTFQIGANANQTVNVTIQNVATSALGQNVSGAQWHNLGQIDVTTEQGAQDAIKVIDAAISQVSTLSGNLGAVQQQTLNSSASNLQTALQNTTQAQSVIRDTDFAAETANYSKQQVLMQVGTAVLQNANQSSQLVLKLFQ